MAAKRICSIPGCGNNVLARGWCGMHYQRWYHRGTPHWEPKTEIADFIEYAVGFAGDECLTWPFARTSTGRGALGINGKIVLAHRYICEMVHGKPPSRRLHSAHSCGKGHLGCVNPRHLRWATAKENAADREIHGTSRRGVASPSATIPSRTVEFIREMRGKITGKELSEMTGVSRTHICHIQLGKARTDCI